MSDPPPPPYRWLSTDITDVSASPNSMELYERVYIAETRAIQRRQDDRSNMICGESNTSDLERCTTERSHDDENSLIWADSNANVNESFMTEQPHNVDTPLMTSMSAASYTVKKSRKDFRASHWSGWRKTALINIVIVLLVLCLNIGIYAYGKHHFKIRPDGQGSLLQGDCKVINRYKLGGHAVINVLSTLLLGSSNFAMQVLVAPTRQEVDHAHKTHNFLDIGVQSVRNIFHIDTRRTTLWLMLGLTAVPLHLLYNSVLYPSALANEYYTFAVRAEFLDGAPFVISDPTANMTLSGIQVLAMQGRLTYLNRSECIDAYAVQYQARYRNLLTISANVSTSNSSSVPPSSVLSYNVSYPKLTNSFAWMCSSFSGDRDTEPNNRRLIPASSQACTAGNLHLDTQNETLQYLWPFGQTNITGCWAQESSQELCELNFNATLLLTVIILNLVKLIIIFLTLFLCKETALITVGDAIASFLQVPDSVKSGNCFSNCTDFRGSLRHNVPKRKFGILHNYRRWSSAISDHERVTSVFIVLFIFLTPFFFTIWTTTQIDHPFSAGLGAISPNLLLSSGHGGKIGNLVCLANAPQIGLSICYICFNRALTSMYISREWAQFSQTRKGLRVTKPSNKQRGTFWLSLPYRLSIPLMIISVLMHYLVSQCLFIADVVALSASGDPPSIDVDGGLLTLGYSPPALLCVTVIALVAFLFLIGLSGLKNPTGLPIMRSCSGVIAAACHRPRFDVDAYQEKVKWGVVFALEGTVEAQCCFTSYEVRMPLEEEEFFA